jgi:hypothetical protein
MIYDIKHDGRHKARLVAGGHLTDPTTESVYSGVVSLRGIRLIFFLSDLNKLSLWVADIGIHTLRQRRKRRYLLLEHLNLDCLKDVNFSLTGHCMA